MTHTAAEHTADELLAAVAVAGAPISRAQLHRWQQEGLIPKPRRRGRGRARGVEAVYPAGTTEQVLAVRAMLKSDRSLEGVRWRLWWDGYPVPEEGIRDQLRRHLDASDDFARRMRELNADQSEGENDPFAALAERAQGRHAGLAFGPLRRRTGKARFATFLLDLSAIGTGTFEGWPDASDGEVLAKGLGLARAEPRRAASGRTPFLKLFNDAMRAVTPVFDPRAQREAFESATLEELHTTRRELRSLLELVNRLHDVFDVLLGRGVLRAAMGAAELSVESQRFALLSWLSVRRARPSWYKRLRRYAAIFARQAAEPDAAGPLGTEPRP